MSNCINIKTKEFQELLEATKLPSLLLEMKVSKFQEENGLDSFPTEEDILKSDEVNYTLKSIDILDSEKAKQVFKKGNKNNWSLDKILTELQIPKEQKQLLLDLDITDREQLAIELVSNYSYSVEINITKDKAFRDYGEGAYFVYNGYTYENLENPTSEELRYYKVPGTNPDTDYFEKEEYIYITKEEFEKAKKELENIYIKNSNYYSSLTVPGGTAYTENEISTPLITPSIKGHAQFSTDNGIGWFRSDDDINDENTRRILEVQSDLFQKGRDRKDLISFKPENSNDYVGEHYNSWAVYNSEIGVIQSGFDTKEKAEEWLNPKDNKNQFLQLLNKNNNWVTFFVKSIIQDSVKKGYEKVLFPTGDTASKVEGHTTLEEFIAEKELRISQLEKDLEDTPDTISSNSEDYDPMEAVEFSYNGGRTKEDINREIEQLRQEIHNVENDDIGAFKPIHTFYEKTLFNILKKSYNIEKITDDNGNTWNQITLNYKEDYSPILFNKLEDENKSEEIFSIGVRQDYVDNTTDNTQSNKQLLFNSEDRKSYEVQEVLTNIINQGDTDLQENFKVLLKKSQKIISNTKAKVEVDTLENLAKRFDNVDRTVAMVYDVNTNKIIIAEEALNRLTPQQIIQSFVHEVAHAITHKAIKNPQSFEEREFSKFILEAFEQHKTISNTRDDVNEKYGFESVDEFVAEIYSNPEFQNELKKNSSWWNEFKNWLRTLFGLTKNLQNNELIDALLVIQTVEEFVEGNNNSEFKGFSFEGDTYSPALFKSVLNDKKEGYYEFKTIDDQVDYVINKAKDVLDQNINKYKALTNTAKKEDKPKWQKFVKSFEDTLKALENYNSGEELKAIVNYIKSLNTDIKVLEKSFDKKSFTEAETLKVIDHYTKYLDSFTIARDIQSLLSDIKVNNKFGISDESIQDADFLLKEIIGTYDNLKSEYNSYLKHALKLTLSNIKYLPELETKWKEELQREYKKAPRVDSEDVWVAKAMNTTYKDDIDSDIEIYLNNVIDSPAFDISYGTRMFNDSINTNSHLVQIFNQILNEIKESINSQVRVKEFELNKLFNELIKEKGTEDVSKLYKNILQQDKEGNYYLLTEYKLEFKDKLDKIDFELNEIEKEKGKASTDFKNKLKERYNILKSLTSYKNNIKLTTTEQKVLDTFIEIQDLVSNVSYEKNKRKFVGNKKFNTVYYQLPSITKSDLERVLGGDIKGTIKDKWTDLTTIKSDDVEFNYRTDNEHNILYKIPVRYQSKISSKDQSLDLMTVYRLQHLNGINYKEKTKRERELNTILDIAKTKQYYRTQSGKEKIKSVFNKNNKETLVPGSTSNTYKRIESLLEKNIYDVGHHYSGKLGSVDINKAIGFVNGATATIGLSLNRFAATANVLNSKAQLFLETLSKNVIDKSNLGKAEALYTKELANTMRDLGQPVEKSFINQMNRMFDTFGFNQNSNEGFIKKGVIKSYVNAGTLQFMHKGGEHWVQSVLTAATLDSIKVMDADNNYIDKKGNIVEKSKSASLLDMLYIDETDGILKINDKVVYTTHSLTSKINEGGKEKVNQLIKKKIFDCFGNYDPNTQPEAMRHWWGKLFMMFRRFFVEMGTKRYMGFSNSFKSKDEIEADPDKYKHYSYALQSYEEGVYTSLMRFLRHGVYASLKQMKFDIMSKEWNKLSDTEKGNIKYAVGEIVTTSVILPLIAVMLASMIGGAGDDDETVYFWLYQVNRIESELAQYRNPSANIKILRSPIPSMRIIENSLDAISKTINVFDWDETYKSGPNKGDLKVTRAWEKLVPVLNNINRDSEDLYKYQKSMFGIY